MEHRIGFLDNAIYEEVATTCAPMGTVNTRPDALNIGRLESADETMIKVVVWME
jgi:hypothetical protein